MWTGRAGDGGLFLRTPSNDPIFLLEKYTGDNIFFRNSGKRKNEMEQNPSHIGNKSSTYCAPTVRPVLSPSGALFHQMITTMWGCHLRSLHHHLHLIFLGEETSVRECFYPLSTVISLPPGHLPVLWVKALSGRGGGKTWGAWHFLWLSLSISKSWMKGKVSTEALFLGLFSQSSYLLFLFLALLQWLGLSVEY